MNEPTTIFIRRTAVCLLMNYIALVTGVPTLMHFTDDYEVTRTIIEKESGKPKKLTTFVFYVDELNGEPCAKTFSILSQKLLNQFQPYLKDKEYTKYDFILCESGAGFYKDWEFRAIKKHLSWEP